MSLLAFIGVRKKEERKERRGERVKIVVLHGSPRKRGDSFRLLSYGLDRLDSYIYYNLYKEKISPCIDCRYCHIHDHCFMDDNMNNILEDIFTADGVIIASPIYFAALPGEFLNFASRTQYIFANRFIRKNKINIPTKKGIAVLTGGGSGGVECAKRSLQDLCLLLKIDLIDVVASLETDKTPVKEDEPAMLHMEKAMDSFLETLK